MDDELKNKIYTEALSQWGSGLQKLMMIEEAAELQKAIVKNIRNGDGTYAPPPSLGFVEELADVSIMVEQMELYLMQNGFYDDYQKFKEEKLRRVAGMLDLKLEE